MRFAIDRPRDDELSAGVERGPGAVIEDREAVHLAAQRRGRSERRPCAPVPGRDAIGGHVSRDLEGARRDEHRGTGPGTVGIEARQAEDGREVEDVRRTGRSVGGHGDAAADRRPSAGAEAREVRRGDPAGARETPADVEPGTAAVVEHAERDDGVAGVWHRRDVAGGRPAGRGPRCEVLRGHAAGLKEDAAHVEDRARSGIVDAERGHRAGTGIVRGRGSGQTPVPSDAQAVPFHDAMDQLVAAPIVDQTPPATSTPSPGPAPSAS